MTIPPEKFELTVSELLGDGQFITDMHHSLQSDPLFLTFHHASTMIRVNRILFSRNIRLPSTLDTEQFRAIIKEAIRRTLA